MMQEADDLIWKALGNPARRRLMDLLRNGPKTTSALAGEFPDLSRFAVMQHLELLTRAGLVLVRRQGRERFNYVNPVPLREAYERWVSQQADMTAAGVLSLKRFVERGKQEGKMDESAGKVARVETEVRLNAPAERVFRALTEEINDWWAFRTRPDARIVYETRIGGRCYEEWPGGGGLLYGEVVRWEPGVCVETRGPGGVGRAYHTYNRDHVSPDGEGCVYRKSLVLWGEVPPEIVKMYTEGSRYILEQMLRDYVEHGKGYTPPQR